MSNKHLNAQNKHASRPSSVNASRAASIGAAGVLVLAGVACAPKNLGHVSPRQTAAPANDAQTPNSAAHAAHTIPSALGAPAANSDSANLHPTKTLAGPRLNTPRTPGIGVIALPTDLSLPYVEFSGVERVTLPSLAYAPTIPAIPSLSLSERSAHVLRRASIRWHVGSRTWQQWLAIGGFALALALLLLAMSRWRKRRPRKGRESNVLLGWEGWHPCSGHIRQLRLDSEAIKLLPSVSTFGFSLTGTVSVLLLTAFFGRRPEPIGLRWAPVDLRIEHDAPGRALATALKQLRRRTWFVYGELKPITPQPISLALVAHEMSMAIPSALAFGMQALRAPAMSSPQQTGSMQATPDVIGTLADIQAETTAQAVAVIEPPPTVADAIPSMESLAAPTSGRALNDAIAEAKRRLTLDQPKAAIEQLRPLLDSGNANGEAWTVAGWSWWRMARDEVSPSFDAAGHAADAFRQAMAIDPDRTGMLSHAVARCFLLRAEYAQGAQRLQALDQALEIFSSRKDGKRLADNKLLIEWVGALYQRAMATPPSEREPWLDRAEKTLLQRADTARTDVQIDWLQVQILLARAALVDVHSAGPLHARAFELLMAGYRKVHADQRDHWLGALIDGERAYIGRIQGAARMARFKALHGQVRDLLDEASSITPLLAWLNTLKDWSTHLAGPLARAKLTEAETLLERIAALVPEEAGMVDFVRAYYLRLRAQTELGGQRLQTLREALQLLQQLPQDLLAKPMVTLESAEVQLARALLLDGEDARAALTKAATQAEQAGHARELEKQALVCALSARLALADSPQAKPEARDAVKPLAMRLLTLALDDSQALQLAARARLLCGDSMAASELCDAAWRAGASDKELLPLWKNALARWAKSLPKPDLDTHWLHLHQRLRIASSTR